MELPDKSYPAKLLLFGEYTILEGTAALALPFPAFSGHWTYSRQADPTLKLLADYLHNQAALDELRGSFDYSAFRNELERGLSFASNIPTGYGLGSSGALTAAVYDAFFAKVDASPGQLKQLLAQIEGFFHGTSSGTDPLICYLRQPILLEGKNRWRTVEAPLEDPDGTAGLFLLDTGISRQTGPLVELFLKKCAAQGFGHRLQSTLMPAVGSAIEAFLQADWAELWRHFRKISRHQWELFPEMIPGQMRPVWETALDSKREAFKLCGAGGGGFLLGISRNLPATMEALKAHPCLPAFRW